MPHLAKSEKSKKVQTTNLQNNKMKPSPTSQTVLTLGYWSAILASVLTIAFIVLAFAFPPKEWTGIEAYAASFNNLQIANLIPVILLAPTVIVLMACIYYITPESKRVFTLIGIVFSCVYTAIICTNYFIQLYVVRLSLISGTLNGIALLAMTNLHSIFFALETFGYAFLSLATLFISPVFNGGKLENWIRSLFIISAAVGIFGAIVAPFDPG